MATQFADFNTLRKHVQNLVREFNAKGPKKADCVEMTQAARECIELASPSDLGEGLFRDVLIDGAPHALKKFLGLSVERWNADEVRVDCKDYGAPMMPTRG